MRIQSSFVLSDPKLPGNPIVFASEKFLQLTGYPRRVKSILLASLRCLLPQQQLFAAVLSASAHRCGGYAWVVSSCVLCDRERVVGRNCKFLQGPGTDPAVIAKLRQALYAPAPKPITVPPCAMPSHFVHTALHAGSESISRHDSVA